MAVEAIPDLGDAISYDASVRDHTRNDPVPQAMASDHHDVVLRPVPFESKHLDNAIEAALWIRRHGYRSLHLVTASYHMPRSLLLFQQAMPNVSLHANPVFSDRVKLADWWRFPGTMKLLAVEYSKYLVSLLRVRLTGPAG